MSLLKAVSVFLLMPLGLLEWQQLFFFFLLLLLSNPSVRVVNIAVNRNQFRLLSATVSEYFRQLSGVVTCQVAQTSAKEPESQFGNTAFSAVTET